MSALTTAARPRPQRTPADAGRRPALHVVPPQRRTGRYLAAMAVVAAVGVFGSVSLSALAAESAFAARELESEIDELSVRYDELTAEVARLESPGRVLAVASEELGMVRAEQPAYLIADRPLGGLPVVEPTSALLDADGAPVQDPVKQALGQGQ